MYGAEGGGGKGGAEAYGPPARYGAVGGEFCGMRCVGELGRCARVGDDAASMDVRYSCPCSCSISAGES
jgi:hypothetical protein